MQIIDQNDPCRCGSGKKYQQCCLPHDEVLRASKTHVIDTFTPKPEDAGKFYNAGNALQVQGRLDEAVENYRKALALKPDYPEACNNLGIALLAQGKPEAAAESFRKALALKPDYAKAHNNLGNALQAQGRFDEAALHYRKAFALKPDYAEAHNNLGNALLAQDEPDAAIESYRKALALNPGYVDAHYNLGNALQTQGKLDAAAESYRNALSLQPYFVSAHNNLGKVFLTQGKLEEAVESYRNVLVLQPDYAEAYCNLGVALLAQDQLDEAVANYHQALSLKPDYPDAYNNLGIALQAQGNFDMAIESYHSTLSLKPDHVMAHSNLRCLHCYHTSLSPQAFLSLARDWELACISAEDRAAAHNKPLNRTPLTGRRLRVGYVSGEYCQQALSYFIEQLFTHHDKTRLELFAYSIREIRDAVTERLETLVDHWVPVAGMSDSAVLNRIESDGIDVLIDLSGHIPHNRLGVFARRAAPVQAHYLGYPGSTGLTEMDYWIGDETLTPASTDSHFSEQVWRLPRVWVSYEGKADAPIPDWHPSQDGILWLGSFNNLSKLTAATLALWAKVLHALPESKLLLKTGGLSYIGNRQRILDTMSGHGIFPDRIELQDSHATPDWAAHMAYYDRLDIALDPVGAVGGGTTTCDALWMGVPLITLEGDRMASRMSSSILTSINRPEWIARSEAEYTDKAAALARNVELRKALRSAQRSRMASSPLCDAKNLAMTLENAYFEMFERWLARQNKQPPIIS